MRSASTSRCSSASSSAPAGRGRRRGRSTPACWPKSPPRGLPATRWRASPPGSASRSSERHSARGDAETAARSSGAGAQAARGGHPHARGGRARLPLADRHARRAASRRLGRAGRAPGPVEPWRRPPHRQPALPPSHRRDHARAGRSSLRPDGRRRGPRAHDARADLVALCASRRGRAPGGALRDRDRHRARHDARAGARRVRRRWTGPVSAIASHPLVGGSGRRLRLSGGGAHEPARHPPSRGHGRRPAMWSGRCRRATCCGCAGRGRSRSATRSSEAADVPRLAQPPGPGSPGVAAALLGEGMSGRADRRRHLAPALAR
jgi:hypothetical protein